MAKEKTIKKTTQVNQESFRCTESNVLVRVIKEQKILFGDVVKADTHIAVEPYVEIISVGNNITTMKPGDLAMCKIANRVPMELLGDHYCVVWESDIYAIITKEMAEEISGSNLATKIKDTIVN